MPDKILPDNHVIVYQDHKRNWLVKAAPGKQFHTSEGHINFDEVIGKPFGITVYTHLGTPLMILRPTVLDFVLNAPRKTNIIYPKDAGLILLHAGIASGSRVVESGVGSGALTSLIASIVKPDGHLYAYEIRRDFIELAERNLKRASLSKYVTIHHQDITKGIKQTSVDAVILDLGDPWLVVAEAWKALRPSGKFASYSPTIDQVMRTVKHLHEMPYCDIFTLECFIREIMVRPGKTRPATRMIGHTGYLTFARKILNKK
ncbi:MAG: tRNA (adenine-N1)-methyltransferase [Candidatus Ranarchaeia archaeon]